MQRLIVDGMNVIGSRPDGWWRDRDGAVRSLAARLVPLTQGPEYSEVTVVFDGRPLPDLPEGEHDGVVVLYARRSGRDAADDRIVELIDDARTPSACEVATSDRSLRERVQSRGAAVRGASSLRNELDGRGGGRGAIVPPR